MAIAEELIVALRSEGAAETKAAVNKVGDSVDATKKKVGGAADSFSDFRAEISGAMSAVVAGLAIAAGGLASQVPVIGGVLEGLSAIVSAVAFQIDGVLRPALQPVIDKLFEWSNAIYESDGALGTVIGVIGSAIIIIGTLAAGVLAAAKAWGALTVAYGIVKAAGAVVVGAIGTVVGAIGAIPLVIAAVIAAIIGFALAYKNNWFGIRDITNNVIDGIIERWTEFTDWLQGAINDLVDSAYAFGVDMLERFIRGIKARISDLRNVIGNIIDSIEARLGIDLGTTSGGVGPRQGASTFSGDSRTRTISMDGRKLDESLGRYGRDTTTRRGI
jgi:hypothetical protein